MIGAYVEGDSVLHRCRPGTKVLAMLLLVSVLGFFPRWWLVVPAAGVLALAYPLCGLRLGGILTALRGILILGIVVGALQLWWYGPERAVEIVGQLLVAVLAGNLIMMTTRVSEMVRTISVVAVPLRPFGIRRQRLELLLSLTIGCIPRVALAMSTAKEAAVARGVRPRLRVVAPSVVVSIVREADEVGDAMAARGL